MSALTLVRLVERVVDRLYIDVGDRSATTFIAGMGRSGTTWVGAVVNHDGSYRVLFEPFRPRYVPSARIFGRFAYVRPDDRMPERVDAAESILAGKTPRGTVDRGHRGLIFRHRIVKEVRCNLMLGWLKGLRPGMPLILVMRNPFAVAASWLRLQWGMPEKDGLSELDVILGHQALLDDFPVIDDVLATIDRTDAFDRVMVEWCILHLIPGHHLHAGDAHVLCYEHMLEQPRAEAARLATYLGRPIQGPTLDRALATMRTDFLGRGSGVAHEDLLGDWKEVLSSRQVERGHRILADFGLDRLYDAQGMPSGAFAFPGPRRPHEEHP